MEKKIIWRNVFLDQQFHIGQIARFFDLPASTLRYWDEVGILTPHKNHTNSYREYTVSDLMTISDIIFYKNRYLLTAERCDGTGRAGRTHSPAVRQN